ncbi:hypothetical protein M5689_021699 [Euphorbia peplus]|nr:hypothetical protein M5689_021699 [Euphorbia peplus]
MSMGRPSYLLVLFFLLLLQPYKPVGIGSSPPKCEKKCKGCTPCTTILVRTPPIMPKAADYYPVVWKCTCKGHIYDPDH